jgi:hypothetical protein
MRNATHEALGTTRYAVAEAAIRATFRPGENLLMLGVSDMAGAPGCGSAVAWGVGFAAVHVLSADGSVAAHRCLDVSEVRHANHGPGDERLVLEVSGVPVSVIDRPLDAEGRLSAFLMGRAVLRRARGERSRLVDPAPIFR